MVTGLAVLAKDSLPNYHAMWIFQIQVNSVMSRTLSFTGGYADPD
jgi:hypothetical protein